LLRQEYVRRLGAPHIVDNLTAIIFVIIVYTANYFVLKNHTSGWVWLFSVCYLNGILAPVFLLSYSNIIFGFVSRRLSIGGILWITMLSALVWEFIAPLYNSKSVTDWFDVLAYVVGGLIYIVLIDRRHLTNYYTNTTTLF